MSPRRLIGAGIWVLGIVGLGIWASQTVAPSIEARLAAQSAAIVEGAVHGVTAQVDGRDVILSGIMDGTNERGRIMTALNSLPSVREIRDQSLVLPTIYPYDITAKRTVDGIQWKGHIPTEAARSRIGALIGSEAAAQLTWAAGVPDTDWVDLIEQGHAALLPLRTGTFSLSDRTAVLTGLALSPIEQSAAEASLTILPGGYNAEIEIETLDDGTPFSAVIKMSNGGAEWVTGKLPASMDALALDSALGQPVVGDIKIAQIGSKEQDWPDAMNSALRALSHLQVGTLEVIDRMIILKGTATLPEDAAKADAALAVLPRGFDAVVEITALDDGSPFALTITWGDDGLIVAGKLPAVLSRDDLAIALEQDPDQVYVTQSVLGRDRIDWRTSALMGIDALSELMDGRLVIDANSVNLTGRAATPGDRAEVDEALAGVPEGFSIKIDVSVEDDGTPYFFSATKTVDDITLDGKVPASVRVNFDKVLTTSYVNGAPVRATIGRDEDTWVKAIDAANAVLQSLETGVVTIADFDINVQGVAPSAEAEAVILAALEAVPTDFGFSLDMTVLDDTAPIAFSISLSTGAEPIAVGALPARLNASKIADALGVSRVSAEGLRLSPGGSEVTDLVLETFESIGPYLGLFETVDMKWIGEHLVAKGVAAAGIPAAQLQARLSDYAEIEIFEAAAPGADGDLRTNVLTETVEQRIGGFWLPATPPLTTAEGCNNATQAAIAPDAFTLAETGAELNLLAMRALNLATSLALTCTRGTEVQLSLFTADPTSPLPALIKSALVNRGVAVGRIALADTLPEGAPKIQSGMILFWHATPN
jgi:OOP family OmpA-OmpF porin